MLSPQHYVLLKKLEDLLRDGTLTATDRVAPGTFICMTHETPFGLAYHQSALDTIPEELARSLHGVKVGERIGPFKIVAVYDIWPINWDKKTPPVQVFDN